MLIAIILCIVFSLAFVARQGASPYFKTFSLSIFGFCFFCFWTLFDYAVKINNGPSWLAESALTILLAIASLILILPPVRRVGLIATSIVTSLFFSCAISTLTFNYTIKNTIAEFSGYFNGEIKSNTLRELVDHASFEDDTSGVSLVLPKSWSRRDAETLHNEFEKASENNLPEAELLISCFHGSNEPITEVIHNLASYGDLFKSTCANNENFYQCHVEYFDSVNDRSVWRYLAFAKHSGQRAEVHIRSSNASEAVEQEVQKILDSIEVKVLNEPLSACYGSMDWF